MKVQLPRVKVKIKLPPKVKRHLSLHFILLHIALTVFFADVIAFVWPAFEHWWHTASRVGVALAAFLACLAEYVPEEIELKKERNHVEEEQAAED